MEKWTVHDDRPSNLPPASSFPWIPVVLALVLAGGGLAYYYGTLGPAQPLAPKPEAPVLAEKPAAAPPAEPAVRYPVPADRVGEVQKPLPSLADSDAMMRESLSSLIGARPFADMVVPSDFIRRIVATVDNLPRPTAPRRAMPLNPVPGTLATGRAGEDTVLDASNYARYEPFVRVMESVETQALVYSYLRAYPLFQRAYEELGFPGKYFNDRLVQAIDNLLAAPDVTAPVRITRDKVLYTFVDEDLENRSAGQKTLIRMGPENARRVKAKLADIRKAITR